jgi:lysophospholipase L1-like esterase
VEICSERNVKNVDLFANNSDSSRNSLYIKDSVHFSIAGHQLIANNLYREISDMLNN